MKKIMFLFIAGSLVMAGCKKEGCTDSKATNFDEKAKKDDGSCKFATVEEPEVPEPVTDAEKPVVTISKPAAGTKVTAGEKIDIAATITDNVGATSWKYSWKGEAGTVLGLTESSLGGAKSESVTASPAIGTSTAAGSYTLTITAKDAAGNESVAATVSFTVEEAKPNDSEKPVITEPKKTFPTSGVNIPLGSQTNKGAKFDIEVTDNMELESVTILLINSADSGELFKLEETGINAKTYSKNIHIKYTDSNAVPGKAKVKIIAKDKAGNEKELLSTQEYDLTLS